MSELYSEPASKARADGDADSDLMDFIEQWSVNLFACCGTARKEHRRP